MNILQVCAFGADYPGNFISSLIFLELEMRKSNPKVNFIYVFVNRANNKKWCKNLQKNHIVYFLEDHNARISLKVYLFFKKLYKKHHIDVVHTHFELFDIPATITAPKYTKIFWHLHDPVKDYYCKTKKSRKLLMKYQYKYFSKRAKVLTVSQLHGDFICELGFDHQNLVYLPNGININRIKNAYKQSNQNRFLMFGWEVKRKGVDVLCNAQQYLSDLPLNFSVVGNNACYEYLKNRKCNKIIFLNSEKDVNILYSKHDVFLHLSRSEGLSYALLEAIYAGLPVICSDIQENDFARDFKGVFFVKVGDSKNLSLIIREITNKHKLLTYDDVQFNRDIIEERYSLSWWTKKVIKLYND